MTADTIRDIRARLGLSQAEFARLISVPVRSLQGWEFGRPIPAPAVTLLRLLEANPEILGALLRNLAAEG